MRPSLMSVMSIEEIQDDKQITGMHSLEALEYEKELKLFSSEQSCWAFAKFYLSITCNSLLLGLSTTGSTLFNGFGLFIAGRSGEANRYQPLECASSASRS